MQVHIDSVSDLKTNEFGPSSKIKCGNASYYVNEDATPLIGKDIEITTETKTSAKGNKYQIAKIVKILEPAQTASSNGAHQITWTEYRTMAGNPHALALELEPDCMVPGSVIEGVIAGSGTTVNVSQDLGRTGIQGQVSVDRSAARAAILNTIMIAFSNGKISLEVEDEDIPF